MFLQLNANGGGLRLRKSRFYFDCLTDSRTVGHTEDRSVLWGEIVEDASFLKISVRLETLESRETEGEVRKQLLDANENRIIIAEAASFLRYAGYISLVEVYVR